MSFEFTDGEMSSDQLAHARFCELLDLPETRLLALHEAGNQYGEWLFVVLEARVPRLHNWSPVEDKRRRLTFWGLGFHESREQWLVDTWRWYEGGATQRDLEATDKTHAHAVINERQARCRSDARMSEAPSAHARAFRVLADLTDDDGATSELRDLGALGFDLEDLLDD